MTPASLTAWRARLNLNKSKASLALGLSRNALIGYENGSKKIPRYVELATYALEHCPEIAALESRRLVARPMNIILAATGD